MLDTLVIKKAQRRTGTGGRGKLVGGTSMGMVQRLADSRGWNRGADVLRRLAGSPSVDTQAGLARELRLVERSGARCRAQRTRTA